MTLLPRGVRHTATSAAALDQIATPRHLTLTFSKRNFAKEPLLNPGPGSG